MILVCFSVSVAVWSSAADWNLDVSGRGVKPEQLQQIKNASRVKIPRPPPPPRCSSKNPCRCAFDPFWHLLHYLPFMNYQLYSTTTLKSPVRSQAKLCTVWLHARWWITALCSFGCFWRHQNKMLHRKLNSKTDFCFSNGLRSKVGTFPTLLPPLIAFGGHSCWSWKWTHSFRRALPRTLVVRRGPILPPTLGWFIKSCNWSVRKNAQLAAF